MTVIAYRDGTMACDSCWNANGGVDTLATKIFRLPSGALLGQAGGSDGRPLIELFKNVKTFKGMPSYADLSAIRIDSACLLVLPSRKIIKAVTTWASPENWTTENATEAAVGAWEITEKFAAVGCGSDLAYGALELGADAIAACRIACKRDLNCRPPIYALHFGEKK